MERGRRVGRVVAGVGIAIALGLLAQGLYPADLPVSRNPDFIDNVFDNRGVLWAARLLLVSAAVVLAFGGIFIVLSIGIRMKNGEWLRRAGPFEISEGNLTQARNEIDFWFQAALRSREEAASLRGRLEHFEESIENSRDP
jgi:hypothetical protein